MRITEVLLRVDRPAEAAGRLAMLLDAPVEGAVDGPVVRIGWTRVRPVVSEGDGVDHLAVLVPGDGLPAALDRLRSRTGILPGTEGAVVEGPPGWHSSSVYFDGPGGCVLELIGHRRAFERGGAGTPLGICEVGIAVPDVSAAALALTRVGLRPFVGPPGADFAAVGDVEGRVILVAPGRAWFPTSDRVAGAGPLRVDAETGCPGEVRLGAARLVAA